MFYLMVLLGLAAAAAHYAATREAKKYDAIVSERHWETNIRYMDSQFIGWVSSGKPSVKGYASVLAPYDIALLLALGVAFAAGSFAAAAALGWPSGVKWALLLCPLAFSAADLMEDRRLLELFAAKAAKPADVHKLKSITLVKFVTLGLATAQTVIPHLGLGRRLGAPLVSSITRVTKS